MTLKKFEKTYYESELCYSNKIPMPTIPMKYKNLCSLSAHLLK